MVHDCNVRAAKPTTSTPAARPRLMSSLPGELAHGHGTPAQTLLDDVDAQAAPGQDRRLTAVTESHALDADVLGEQQGAERALDERDGRQGRGEVAAGGGQDRGLADLAADLDSQAGREPGGGHRER